MNSTLIITLGLKKNNLKNHLGNYHNTEFDGNLGVLFYLFWGHNSSVLRAYSWLCCQKSLLEWQEQYEVPRFKPRTVTRQVFYLLCSLSLPQKSNGLMTPIRTKSRKQIRNEITIWALCKKIKSLNPLKDLVLMKLENIK